jgi:tetratricopeptide (TPR) repeat protein
MTGFTRYDPPDPAALDSEVARCRARLSEPVDDDQRVLLLGSLGGCLLALGRQAEAEPPLREALALASEQDMTREWVANTIRLGSTLHSLGERTEAEHLLRKAAGVTTADDSFGLRHTALQHLARFLVDIDLLDEAEPVLTEAISLRERLGDAELLRSSYALRDSLRRRRRHRPSTDG